MLVQCSTPGAQAQRSPKRSPNENCTPEAGTQSNFRGAVLQVPLCGLGLKTPYFLRAAIGGVLSDMDASNSRTRIGSILV